MGQNPKVQNLELDKMQNEKNCKLDKISIGQNP